SHSIPLLPHLAASLCYYSYPAHRDLHSFPTRRSSDLLTHLGCPRIRLLSSNPAKSTALAKHGIIVTERLHLQLPDRPENSAYLRSEEHTSELQSRFDLVCRLLLEKKKNNLKNTRITDD